MTSGTSLLETMGAIPVPTVIENGPESLLQNQDDHDGVSSEPPSIGDLLWIGVALGTYVMDIVTDIILAYMFYKSGFTGYFILTLAFVIVPALTVTAFSLKWYITDLEDPEIPRPSKRKWIFRIIFLLLQVAPILRYIDVIICGLKSRKAAENNDTATVKKYNADMIREDSDATLLRLFESFMESAPQVTLQLYILIYHFDDEEELVHGLHGDRNFQYFTITKSLFCLAWSLSAYNRMARASQEGKPKISYRASYILFFWYICTIGARVFALAVFAVAYTTLIIPFCFVHWILMMIWFTIQEENILCFNQKMLLFGAAACVYIFTFFTVSEEPTRDKYLAYYIIIIIENSILLFTWFFATSGKTWLKVIGLVGDYVLFFVGIGFMIAYYVYFHPTRGILFKRQVSDAQDNQPVRNGLLEESENGASPAADPNASTNLILPPSSQNEN